MENRGLGNRPILEDTRAYGSDQDSPIDFSLDSTSLDTARAWDATAREYMQALDSCYTPWINFSPCVTRTISQDDTLLLPCILARYDIPTYLPLHLSCISSDLTRIASGARDDKSVQI
jgi:hypothetical protein